MSVANHQYLIIGGAPKAGTTSLYKYLADHPQICASSLKETRFFLDTTDILPSPDRYDGSNLENYANFYKHCTSNDSIRMEATPDYLYSEQALQIGLLLPNSKMIFIERNPIDRLVSWYKFAKQRGLLDNDTTFEHYVDMQMNLEVTPRTPVHLRALEQGKYSTYLAKFETGMQGRILSISFDELIMTPKETMQIICKFIGINSHVYDNYIFTKENESVSVRNQFIEHIYLSLRRKLSFLVHKNNALKNSLKKPNQIIKQLISSNKRPAEEVYVPPHMRIWLEGYYGRLAEKK